MTYDRERWARVLLLELEEVVSGKGTVYWRGWAGKTRLVGFRNAELNERGFPTIRIYAEEPEPKRDAVQRLAPRQQERTPAPAGAAASSSPAERPGNYRREGTRARQAG